MSEPFQFTKRTIPFALGWLFLSVVAGGFGAWALNRNTTATVFGFVLAFNCFWAAVDSLRGRRFARILLDRAILVFVMMMAYWLLRNGPSPNDRDPGIPWRPLAICSFTFSKRHHYLAPTERASREADRL